MDVYDLICVIGVVIVLALAGALWFRVRRMQGRYWLREALMRAIVLTACLAPLFAFTRDPWAVAASLIVGPFFGGLSVLPDMQMSHYAEEAHAKRAEVKERRERMRALFRPGGGSKGR